MARQGKRSPERKEFIQSLPAHYHPKDARDVQDMLKDLLGDTLQGMLEALLEIFPFTIFHRNMNNPS